MENDDAREDAGGRMVGRRRRRRRRQKGGVLLVLGPVLEAIGLGYKLGKFIGKKLNQAFGKKKRRRK